MSIRTTKAAPEHEVAYQEIIELIGRHSDKMTPAQLLAIASNMVGKMIALQDKRTMTPEEAIQLVMQNIENGNKQAVARLEEAKDTKH